MTYLACAVAALLCTAVDGQALGKPSTQARVETASLRQYVDEITVPEGIGQASARTAVHRRPHGKVRLTQ